MITSNFGTTRGCFECDSFWRKSDTREYFAGAELTKTDLIRWKDTSVEKYATATVNSILAAVNGFLKHVGWNDLTVKSLKIQRVMFRDESRELTRTEYNTIYIHEAGSIDIELNFSSTLHTEGQAPALLSLFFSVTA